MFSRIGLLPWEDLPLTEEALRALIIECESQLEELTLNSIKAHRKRTWSPSVVKYRAEPPQNEVKLLKLKLDKLKERLARL